MGIILSDKDHYRNKNLFRILKFFLFQFMSYTSSDKISVQVIIKAKN